MGTARSKRFREGTRIKDLETQCITSLDEDDVDLAVLLDGPAPEGRGDAAERAADAEVQREAALRAEQAEELAVHTGGARLALLAKFRSCPYYGRVGDPGEESLSFTAPQSSAPRRGPRRNPLINQIEPLVAPAGT